MANKQQGFPQSNQPSLSQPQPSVEEIKRVNATGRVYSGMQHINSDAFKLSNSFMKKNHGIDGHEPLWVEHDHTHFYRTCDSRGTEQKHSPAVGGHFHEVKVTGIDENGRPTAVVGPPLKWIMAKNGRRTQRVAVELEEDKHVHQAVYLRTDLIKVQQISPEFAKFQAAMDSKKPGPVEGVLG